MKNNPPIRFTILIFVLLLQFCELTLSQTQCRDLYLAKYKSRPLLSSRPISNLELQKLLVDFNKLRDLATSMSNPNTKAQPYLETLKLVQNNLITQLKKQGSLIKIIERYDFNGLPVPQILKNASKTVQEDAVIGSSASVEQGLARIAPALEIIPTKDGGVLNYLSYQLLEKFGIKMVVEVGSVDNLEAAAAFKKEGPYMSMSLVDLVTDTLSYQSIHELSHLINNIRNEPASLLNVKVLGDQIQKILGKSLYNSGFSIDELFAYPKGVISEMEHWKKQNTQIVFIPITKKDGKMDLLEAAIDGRRLEFLTKSENRLALLRQLVEINSDFLKVLSAIPLGNSDTFETNTLSAMSLMGETLILIDPKSKLRFSIDIKETLNDGKLKLTNNPLLRQTFPGTQLSFEIPISKATLTLADQVLSNLNGGMNTISDLNQPAFQLWKSINQSIREINNLMPKFISQYKELNIQLADSIEKANFDQAEVIIRNQLKVADDVRSKLLRDPITVDSFLAEIGI